MTRFLHSLFPVGLLLLLAAPSVQAQPVEWWGPQVATLDYWLAQANIEGVHGLRVVEEGSSKDSKISEGVLVLTRSFLTKAGGSIGYNYPTENMSPGQRWNWMVNSIGHELRKLKAPGAYDSNSDKFATEFERARHNETVENFLRHARSFPSQLTADGKRQTLPEVSPRTYEVPAQAGPPSPNRHRAPDRILMELNLPLPRATAEQDRALAMGHPPPGAGGQPPLRQRPALEPSHHRPHRAGR